MIRPEDEQAVAPEALVMTACLFVKEGGKAAELGWGLLRRVLARHGPATCSAEHLLYLAASIMSNHSTLTEVVWSLVELAIRRQEQAGAAVGGAS